MKTAFSTLYQTAKLPFLAVLVGSILAAVPSAFANPVQLLSARTPSIALPAGGNGDSVAPRLSSDGRFVVFSSSASDLVTNANDQFYLNVFLRDRSSGSTVLISPSCSGSGGGNGDSIAGQVSADGRYVVFQSDASDLVSGDTNGVTDIFLRDTYTGVTKLISVASDGGFANGASTQPVMTPDGTCVAFISAASNLVAGDTNGTPDVFVRDLITQTTWLISVGATGANATMDTPLITPDGRYVAFFFSTAQYFPTGELLNYSGEIYIRDRVANQTIWASTNAAAITAGLQSSSYGSSYYRSTHPALSDDGRYVAFKTASIGPIPGGATPPPAIHFLYDSVNGTTTILSTNGFPPWFSNDDVYGPEMTPDGRFVAYVQNEQAGGTNYSSVRLWDRQTGTNVLVSAGPDGTWPTNSTSHTPALSDDGRYVTFLSDATNLVGNVVSNGLHIYRRDLQTAATVLVDVDTNGVGSQDQLGAIPFLSADGSCVAFAALDGGLITSDNNNASDVLLWDSAVGTNALISVHNPQVIFQTGNLPSSLGQLSLSAAGRWATFTSYASDLVPNDFNGDDDVFVRDLTSGSNVLVSVGLDGNAGSGGPSYSPTISADGRYVVFVSAATNLVAGDYNKAADVFRRDLQTGATILVSANSSGANLGLNDCSSPISSQDGRYVAFLCRTNLSGIQTNLFWRDLNSGVTFVVSSNAHPALPISTSADGQRLAYFDNQSLLYVWDANFQANIYTNSTPELTAAAISPDGNRLLYQTTNQLSAYDLAGASNLFLYPTIVPIEGSSQWSGDGRYVAFVTATNLVAADNNRTNDVYLADLQAGTVTLVSLNQSGTGSAAGPSDSPVVSADGRFVVFRTFATDAAAGIVRPPSLIVFDRLSGTNNLLATGTAGTGWTTWVSQPAFSLNGASLAFQSWDSGLVNGDFNRAGDVFAGDLSGWPALDSDGDGIPDWWMIEYFGHPTGQAGDLSLTQDDADGDGMSNLQEYLAGTDPTNPNSLLALSITTDVTGTNLFLGWSAVTGKNYQVLSATNLSNPVWQVFPANIGTNGSQHYFNVPVADSQRYFRIRCGN